MKHSEAEFRQSGPAQDQPTVWYQSIERIEAMADALSTALKDKSSGLIKQVYHDMDLNGTIRGAMLQAVQKVYGSPPSR